VLIIFEKWSRFIPRPATSASLHSYMTGVLSHWLRWCLVGWDVAWWYSDYLACPRPWVRSQHQKRKDQKMRVVHVELLSQSQFLLLGVGGMWLQWSSPGRDPSILWWLDHRWHRAGFSGTYCLYHTLQDNSYCTGIKSPAWLLRKVKTRGEKDKAGKLTMKINDVMICLTWLTQSRSPAKLSKSVGVRQSQSWQPML
jgi:hypothetical protein